MRFFANFGGFYSYHFSGSAGGEALDFDDAYEQDEMGLVYGFGMEMMKVFFGVNFKAGLTNLMQDKSAGEIYNRAFYFSMGYMF